MRLSAGTSTLLAIAAGSSALAAPLLIGARRETGLAAGCVVLLGIGIARMVADRPLHPSRALAAAGFAALAAAAVAAALPGPPGWLLPALLMGAALPLQAGLAGWLAHAREQAEELSALRAIVARREGDVREQAERIRRLDLFDTASGLLNHRAFAAAVGDALALGARRDQPLALLFVELAADADAGAADRCEELRRVGQAIQSAVRGSDIAGRWDRTQLALLLPGCEDAQPAVRRLRRALGTIDGGGADVRLAGVSIGPHGPWPDAEGLMASAQAALAAARRVPQDADPAIWPIDWGLAAAHAKGTPHP